MARRDTTTEPLSRAEIARVALQMVDRDGSESFSMRALAAELRVTPMAVYHHFESEAEVLQAAVQVWIEAVGSSRQHDDPVETIIQVWPMRRRRPPTSGSARHGRRPRPRPVRARRA